MKTARKPASSGQHIAVGSGPMSQPRRDDSTTRRRRAQALHGPVLVYLAQRRRLARLTVGLNALWLTAGYSRYQVISRAGPGTPPAAHAPETEHSRLTFTPPAAPA